MGTFNRRKESGVLVDAVWAISSEVSFIHLGNFYNRSFRWYILIGGLEGGRSSLEDGALLGLRRFDVNYEEPTLKAYVDSLPRMGMNPETVRGASQEPGTFCSKLCAAQLLGERSSSEFPITEMRGDEGTLPPPQLHSYC